MVFDGLDGEGYWDAHMGSLRLGAGEYFLSVGLRRDRLIRGEDDLLCALRRCRSFRVRRRSPLAAPYPYIYEDTVEWR